ncbi:TNT domain-containing protein [Streptococcus sp. DTU_2020_1000888_1_SI_GRL_NUU_041A]|uniref:TNT domain-containing protein n=1 Tax=Streptococcus sp. DTU_2020_1000888_1_SI_GRL_NUU_041A TaxID=3077723 RepID=UPI0028E94CF8|nr:TNT domain-containing protein [Streptococcus sp. DTU_2020_1000888_1_SI_GRL_NUU_041A]WNU96012.1 TNT domain-containing protein [Streptococcus sp. DTU_2020_1000888_1_SI_GRL_NUU_041A]
MADSVDYKAIAGKDDTVTTDSLAKKGKDDALKMADSKVDQSTTDALDAVDFTEKALESANTGAQKSSTGSSRYNLAVSPEVETALDSLSEEHRNQFIKALKDYGYGLNNSETSATTTPEYSLSSTSSNKKGKLDFTPYGQSTLTDSQGQPTSAYQDLLDLANSKESQPLFNQSASNDYQIKKGDSLAKIGNLHYPDDKEKAAAASMLALQDLHGQNKLNINNKQNRINLTPGDKVNVDLSNYTSEEISALAKGFNKIQSAENKIDTFRQAQEEAKALARAQERQNRASQVRQTRTEARNLSQDQAKQNYTHLTQQATQKSQSSNYSPLYISPLFNLNKGNKVQTVIPYRIGAKSYIPKNSSPVSGGVSDFQNRKGLIDRINNLVNNLPHVSKSISNGAREFGEKLMDNGAREENFVKYIVGRGSVASGEVLDSSSAAIKRMADNPGAALSGILKGVVNSVADVPNTGINLGKTIIDGWTLIPEELPFIQRGALQSFRDSTPYNFPRPLEYSSKAEEDYSIFSPGVLAKGAKLLTKGASALGVTKMTSGVRAAKDLSVTEVTRKSPFAEVAKLEQKGHQSALTEKVLNNIADSARARDASNFSTYARTERILNNIADSANARRASNFYPHIGREKRIDTHRYDLWNRHVNKGLEPSDRAKLTQWSQLLEPEFYLENKKVFDNPDYFNQLTGNAIYPGTPESALGRVDGSIHKDGFLNGEYKESVILPGTRINRIGSNPTGRYFSPAGATFGEKALPPFMKLQPDSDYISLKKIPIREGLVAPWFDEPGMGIQYYTYLPMRELEKGGYLHKIKKE